MHVFIAVVIVVVVTIIIIIIFCCILAEALKSAMTVSVMADGSKTSV